MKNKIAFKFKEMELDQIQDFDVKANTSVMVGNVMFKEGIISRIEVSKRVYDEESLFIELFIGNINVATIVTQDDYMANLDEGYFRIRKMEKYDYLD